jgi:hypothetical protein
MIGKLQACADLKACEKNISTRIWFSPSVCKEPISRLLGISPQSSSEYARIGKSNADFWRVFWEEFDN